MEAEKIMNLESGTKLNEMVEDVLSEYIEFDYGCSDIRNVSLWSDNDKDALELWEHVEMICGCACIARLGADGPNVISHMASVGEEEERVTVYVEDWKEALCKALLLWKECHYGDYESPKWEREMKNAPERIIN